MSIYLSFSDSDATHLLRLANLVNNCAEFAEALTIEAENMLENIAEGYAIGGLFAVWDVENLYAMVAENEREMFRAADEQESWGCYSMAKMFLDSGLRDSAIRDYLAMRLDFSPV